ncbi:uncharacterized protein LOC135299788 isoform X5 [Passer domesticus]|uniref:uncharacterized protein LOC135299788 isoform X5 n=1 Tax=Passer domesticus TaxID=48849 RepID=UPI0030FEE046
MPSFICPEGPAPSAAWDCAGRRHEALGRRGKSEPQERRLRAQERNGEARSSRRSGVCGLKSGTARQEQASALASLSSGAEQREALGRRGKIEPQERRLRAQERNGEARSSRRSGVCGLKSGTARQDRAAGAASAGSRAERRGKIEPPERRLRAQEWNGEARASFSIGFFELRSGTARSRGTTRQERQCLRAQVWNGAARASLELKRSTKGPLGKKGFSRPGHLQGAAAGFALGDLPACRAGLCCGWPFAVVLLWLPGERGNPVRRVRAPVSAPEGGKRSSPGPQPSSPVSRVGQGFSSAPAAFCLPLPPAQRDPLYSGRVTACFPFPALKRLRPCGLL